MLKQVSLTRTAQLDSAIGAAADAFHMDEQTFCAFYEATGRTLWSYLYRTSGNATLADDLMQESYYRFLRVRFSEADPEYMKNYLFRIATNLLRDHWRHAKVDPPAPETHEDSRIAQAGALAHEEPSAESDVMRAMHDLKPRERQLLWLAYVEGSSHREIAQLAGLREQSVRGLLFRARAKFAKLLHRRGLTPTEMRQ
ncbi:MAG TPA: sigma-70 family RNA polymerase sigma factor [Candidatus Acidoferrales bacterium]|nr:sigma-70 family RNA polymerase sigma factor [Candidatus Acidoferrales bacterium]